MKCPTKLLFLIIALLLSGFAPEAQGRDKGSLFARVGKSHHGVTFTKAKQSYRVNDCGESLKCWRQQVVYRATNDTFVYRSQNQASARHDEISSHAIMFHLKGGKIHPGHVYRVRGN